MGMQGTIAERVGAVNLPVFFPRPGKSCTVQDSAAFWPYATIRVRCSSPRDGLATLLYAGPVGATSTNFAMLRDFDNRLDSLGALAERYFPDDPNTCLLKLRQLGELLAREVAERSGLPIAAGQQQVDLLRLLTVNRVVSAQAADLFHEIRRSGNQAVHEISGDHAEALATLKVARQLAIWFCRTFGSPNSGFGPFVPPQPPVDPSDHLRKEIDELRAVAEAARSEQWRAAAEAEERANALLSVEERLSRESAERETWEALALELDIELKRLSAAPIAAPPVPPVAMLTLVSKAEAADAAIELDEAAARRIIDAQLRDVGWEVDTTSLRYASGARPVKGANRAIAEWPTATGPADYALFVGTTLVATVEAKRANKNVMSVLAQAERYAKGIKVDGWSTASGGPWGEMLAPFAFSSNGRPYLKQLETLSGIWFRDLRSPSNASRALAGWPTPAGLTERLAVDVAAAERHLASETYSFGFPLRPYQQRAIEKIEERIAAGDRRMLVAMATGTGKTKLAIAALYRLIAAKRFRRVCFVVDRSALGDQTGDEFKTTKVVGGKAFADLFGFKELGVAVPDADTRVHICTIQGLVSRVLNATEPGSRPAVDQYDLIVVDECHRGYLLDREMSDQELAFRDQADYVSKYRRVLEWFDAVKIGLTATPALHTVDIFGEPVFTYSYREAVIDGFLVDHEPPVRITTALAAAGIEFAKDDEVDLVATKTGEVRTVTLPDELRFEVDAFNRAVITQPFNVAVATELARHIDLSEPAKTLVFAVSDAHADIVVKALRDAFRAVDPGMDEAAIQKITGSVDRPRGKILSFRNDTNPRIAVTVDLLTTGIDIPRIANLVFLRRVNSRILYDQMLGRATRLCPEIGKEAFRIFDAVDLYSRLQNLTDMRPVAASPTDTIAQLFADLAGEGDAAWRAEGRDKLVVKLRRKLGKLTDQQRAQHEAATGETPEATLERLRTGDIDDLRAWVGARPTVGPTLDFTADGQTPTFIPISLHPDKVIDVSRGYGEASKPEDFLDAFSRFVRDNVNAIAALKLVVERPQDLTRAELRALRLALDAKGFTETAVRLAHAQATNQTIVASIIGHVRQAAIGSPLIPFEERVRRAVDRIAAAHPLSPVQRRWLGRIGEQIVKEIVVDRAALDEEPFAADGGFRVIDRRFDGRLSGLLQELNETIWKDVA